MLKRIVGDWGSELDEADYACAIACLGVLEATGSIQHRATSDRDALAAALAKEFRQGERTPLWREAFNVRPALPRDSWLKTVHENAQALAGAWQQHRAQVDHPRRGLRLAVSSNWLRQSTLFDVDELWAWLGHPATGLDALVLATDGAKSGPTPWHWPLRVGVPAGPNSAPLLAALRSAQARAEWVARLCDCFVVGQGRDTCDLLIVGSDDRQRLLEQPRIRLRASFAICLDDPPPRPLQLDEASALFAQRIEAAGVALAGAITPDQLSDWFVETLRSVSHDLPIHAAANLAGLQVLGHGPMIIGSPRRLDQCRIVSLAARQDSVAATINSARREAGNAAGPEILFGGLSDALPPMPESALPQAPPAPLDTRFADALRNRPFTAETVDGVQTADSLDERSRLIEQAREPRWIQANAWRADSQKEESSTLVPGRWNLLGVHIGPTAVARRDLPFPANLIDFSSGEVSVDVQLEMAGADVTAIPDDEVSRAAGVAFGPAWPSSLFTNGRSFQTLFRDVQTPVAGKASTEGETSSETSGGAQDAPLGLASTPIRLPQAGASSLALFGVFPMPGATQLSGRVAVIHRNRVLQTARLTVGASLEAQDGAGPIVIADGPIHARDDDLEERREFDVAIQVSDVGGRLHLAVQRNGVTTEVRLDELDQPIGAIRKALERAAEQWDYAKPMLEQTVFAETLYTLAAHGSALEQHLRSKCGKDIDRWERIHLVPSTHEFLPLEYCYSGPPPRVGAKACPNMQAALEAGGCTGFAPGSGPLPCPNQSNKAYVCPMQFWGFWKVIERNGTTDAPTPAPTPAPAPGTEAASALVPSRQAFGRVRSTLFAASERAFAYVATPREQAEQRSALLESLGRLSPKIRDASDWDQWIDGIRDRPNLLVLVAHTGQHLGTPVLEIGQGQLIGRHEIDSSLGGAAGLPQMLLLLGCSAAGVTEDFQPYPERFREAGVSIVLAPIAPIRGADAIPIAQRLAQRLAARLAMPEPTAFGELLPLLRRELLRDGHPGVMSLVGFGDGDWLLGGP